MPRKHKCKCIEKTNKALEEKNTELNTCLILSTGQARMVIDTLLVERVRGAKKFVLVATYCPICGLHYGTGEPAPKKPLPKSRKRCLFCKCSPEDVGSGKALVCISKGGMHKWP